MSVAEWIKATRSSCSQWAEFFSVVAGEADPLEAIDQQKADEWTAFVTEHLGAPGQQKLFAVLDEPLRNQIGRTMQSVVSLHQRLAQASASGEGSEVSQLMLTIDSSLQRLAIALNRIRPADINENASLPSLADARVPEPEAPEEVTPPERPRPHLQEGSGSGSGPKADSGRRPVPPPRKHRATRPPVSTPTPAGSSRPATTPVPTATPRPSAPERPTRSKAGTGDTWKPVTTSEDPVIPLTQKKGASQLTELPHEQDAPPEPPPPPTPTEGSAAGSRPKGRPTARGTGKGPLRPAATDPRMALLQTYVKRLDREVLGPEEDAALEQVLAILSGALSSDEETLGRRFRFLDQQYAADDEALFSAPLLRDLKKLLDGLTERAVARLQHAAELAQGDRLLFLTGDVEIHDTAAPLPVVQLASISEGLRPDLLPSYLPRLRGPSAGFTFNVGTREGAALVRRVAENRLEFGFIAGPTRLWLTALHVVRSGERGALNIEPGGDNTPAYFEARLTLPANEETYQVAQRFVLAETARFVDRLVTA